MRIIASLFVGLVLVAHGAMAGIELAVPPGVTQKQSGAGVAFGDAKGMTLYTYARDNTKGKSACIDDCAKLWPPLVAAADSKETGDWTLITRDDDVRQWAFRDKPLYTYARDRAPGNAFGDRLGNAWNIASVPITTPPGVALRALFVGRVLTDKRGMTLYSRSDDTKEKSACEKKCLETWLPLAAPQMANVIGDWSPLPRSDGTLQWAYQGKRLYKNANDIKPGDLRGDGVDKIWRAAILDPAAPLPSWVTVQNSDMGEIFADSNGLTLYVFNGSLQKTRELICNDECLSKNWRAVPADADAAASGDWTPVAAEGGGKRWAYKGNLLYSHTRDKSPGAIGGDKWAAGVGGTGGGFSPIQRRRDYEE